MMADHVSTEEPMTGANNRKAACCAISRTAFETMATATIVNFQAESTRTFSGGVSSELCCRSQGESVSSEE